jgi:hypothetical protein
MRYELTDHEWATIKPMLPNKPRGVPRVNDRRILNGIFRVLRSGAPWRDLPDSFGPYTTCYNRFVRWRRAVTLHHFALVNLHIKPTKIGPNVLGGLLFGVGFALIGYCPGTVAAALGQGSWGAVFGMLGLIAGSWLYAEASGPLKKTIDTWGNLGKLRLYDVVRIPRAVMVASTAVVITGVLLVINAFSVR